MQRFNLTRQFLGMSGIYEKLLAIRREEKGLLYWAVS